MMKKNILKIGLPCLIIAIAAIAIIWNSFAPDFIKDIVIPNEEAYTVLAEMYYSNSQGTDGVISYSPCYGNDKKEFLIHCYSSQKDIVITDNQYQAFKVVNDSFELDDHSLSRIYVYDTFVTFGIENGRESLIYSVDGKKPTYVNTPNDKQSHCKIKKISTNWYYAISKSDYERELIAVFLLEDFFTAPFITNELILLINYYVHLVKWLIKLICKLFRITFEIADFFQLLCEVKYISAYIVRSGTFC